MRTVYRNVNRFTRAVIIGVSMTSFGVVASVASAGPGMAKTTKADIMLMQPTTLKMGDNTFEVMVTGADGKPVSNADVSIVLVMRKTASMAEMRNEVKLASSGAGLYAGPGQVMMAGTWSVTVGVRQGGKEIGQKQAKLTAK